MERKFELIIVLSFDSSSPESTIQAIYNAGGAYSFGRLVNLSRPTSCLPRAGKIWKLWRAGNEGRGHPMLGAALEPFAARAVKAPPPTSRPPRHCTWGSQKAPTFCSSTTRAHTALPRTLASSQHHFGIASAHSPTFPYPSLFFFLPFLPKPEINRSKPGASI